MQVVCGNIKNQIVKDLKKLVMTANGQLNINHKTDVQIHLMMSKYPNSDHFFPLSFSQKYFSEKEGEVEIDFEVDFVKLLGDKFYRIRFK